MDNSELDIGAVVSRLMSDPKVADLVKGLKESGEVKIPASAPDLSAIDKSAVMERLPEIMSSLGPLMKDGEKRGGGADADKRNRLLAALKPYLSENRQGVIDSIMSYSKLAGLLDLLPGKGNTK